VARGGGGPESRGLAGSEKDGRASDREKDDDGCRVRGDAGRSLPASEKGRVGVEDEKGDGRLCAADIGVGRADWKDGGFGPITSCMEGRDWR
jgi:hypothetical protein